MSRRQEEIVKKRLIIPLVGLAISFALPTYAQQKDAADPQTTQKILALCKANEEGQNNHDGAAIAALYTRDAVLITTEGPIIGRQAIQKYYIELYQGWHSKNFIVKVDGDAPHLIGTAATNCGQPENGVTLGKARTANLSQSRAIGQRFMFVRSMIGKFGWMPGTLPRTVSY